MREGGRERTGVNLCEGGREGTGVNLCEGGRERGLV